MAGATCARPGPPGDGGLSRRGRRRSGHYRLDGSSAGRYFPRVFAAFLSTILFSISGVCGHRSASLIGGTEANFWRLASAALMLGAWSFAFGIRLGGNALPLFVLSGVVGVGIGDLAMFQALPRLGSRLSLLIIECLGPPVGALVEWLWLGTTLSVREIGWGLMILAGVGLALRPGGTTLRDRRTVIVGSLFGGLSAAATAVGAVLSRKAFGVAGAGDLPVSGADAAFQRILGGLFLGGLCLLVVKRREFRVQAAAPHRLVMEASKRKWRKVWPWIFVNSLAGQTLGVSCMQWGLRTTPTGIVLSIIAVTPVVVIPLSMWFEGERPTVASLAGGVVAIGGVVGLTLIR